MEGCIAKHTGLRGINPTTEASQSLDFRLRCLKKPVSISSNAPTSLLGGGCVAKDGESKEVVVSDATLQSARALIKRNSEKPDRAKSESGDISSLELIAALA
ncbi:hypothetical protein FOL47_009924, partial [Perkinsus chesapeaki]